MYTNISSRLGHKSHGICMYLPFSTGFLGLITIDYLVESMKRPEDLFPNQDFVSLGWKLTLDFEVTSHPSVAKSKGILSLKDP